MSVSCGAQKIIIARNELFRQLWIRDVLFIFGEVSDEF